MKAAAILVAFVCASMIVSAHGNHYAGLDNMCNHPNFHDDDPWPDCTDIDSWRRGWYAYLSHNGSHEHHSGTPKSHHQRRAEHHARNAHKHPGCEPGYEIVKERQGICKSISRH